MLLKKNQYKCMLKLLFNCRNSSIGKMSGYQPESYRFDPQYCTVTFIVRENVLYSCREEVGYLQRKG